MTRKDWRWAGDIVRIMEEAGQVSYVIADHKAKFHLLNLLSCHTHEHRRSLTQPLI